MATVIRLKRGGRTHAPYYRLVVMDGRTRSLGRVIDQIGVYHPCASAPPLEQVDVKKAVEWLGRGAQPSDTVRSILKRAGVIEALISGTVPETSEAAAPEAVLEETSEALPRNEAASETAEMPFESSE
jgi:small subunit ribosomal protein S16